MEFFTNYKGLYVRDDRQVELLIASGGFLQSDNNEKALGYLKSVASRMSAAQSEDEAGTILAEAEQKIRDAQLAEKFMEPVTF